ncbi:hypothetical protein E2320_015698, partial [Naja naja]
CELLHHQEEYDWKLKSAENAIVKLEKNSESIMVQLHSKHLRKLELLLVLQGWFCSGNSRQVMAASDSSCPEELFEVLAAQDPVVNGSSIWEEKCGSGELNNEGTPLMELESKDPCHSEPSRGDHLSENESSKDHSPSILTESHPEEKQKNEEVLCDFCLAEKVQAVKSCLTCMVNYCQDHLRPHLENVKLKSHNLMDPLKDIDIQSCKTHKRHLSWFCHSDLICICEECLSDGHQNHQAVICAVARKEKE